MNRRSFLQRAGSALLVSGACEQIPPGTLATAGFDRCLPKPVEPRSLLQLLQPLLTTPSGPGAP